MNFFDLFRILLWQPLFNLLIFFYLYLPGHDFGLAIIILTILIRFLLWPLQKKAIHSQMVLQEIQQEAAKLQEKYKNDKVKLGEEVLKLVRLKKTSLSLGYLIFIIQVPILLALYRVFGHGFESKNLQYLYPFLKRPESINPSFFGIIDLARPNFLMALFLGFLTFYQQKYLLSGQKNPSGFSGKFQKQMLYFTSIFLVLVLSKLPSALTLYLIVSTLFTIFQQIMAKKDFQKHGK